MPKKKKSYKKTRKRRNLVIWKGFSLYLAMLLDHKQELKIDRLLLFHGVNDEPRWCCISVELLRVHIDSFLFILDAVCWRI